MDNPRITVLMPVYNGEKYLKESIDSILNQTYSDFEFLIINDCSQDTSEDIILSYNDDRIKYIKNNKNLGISKTLNKGIDLARGSYIARMDCDDISMPNRLKLQYKYMIKNKDVGICGTWANTFGENTGKLCPPSTCYRIKARLLFCSPFVHPSIMFDKYFLDKHNIRYNENCRVEDLELWMRCSKITKFYNIPKPLLKYRIVNSSLSHNIYKKQMFDKEKIELMKQYLESSYKFNISNQELNLQCLDIKDIHNTYTYIHMKEWLNKLKKLKKTKKICLNYYMNEAISDRWYEYFISLKSKRLSDFFCYIRAIEFALYKPYGAFKLLIMCIIKK